MATYHVGDLAHLTTEFTAIATGALADPTTVTFTIDPPGGPPFTVTPIRDSQGVYHYDQPCTLAGIWQWRATGTGAVQAVNEEQFVVAQPAF